MAGALLSHLHARGAKSPAYRLCTSIVGSLVALSHAHIALGQRGQECGQHPIRERGTRGSQKTHTHTHTQSATLQCLQVWHTLLQGTAVDSRGPPLQDAHVNGSINSVPLCHYSGVKVDIFWAQALTALGLHFYYKRGLEGFISVSSLKLGF